MITRFISVAVVLVITLILDGFWLATMVPLIYKKKLGHLLASSASLLPAITFYCLYAIGIYVFVVMRSLENKDCFFNVAVLGALFGLIAYATYDLTNQATLKDWPIVITIVDMAWGMVMTSISSSISYIIIKNYIIK